MMESLVASLLVRASSAVGGAALKKLVALALALFFFFSKPRSPFVKQTTIWSVSLSKATARAPLALAQRDLPRTENTTVCRC
jgi:hypothetical protein